MKTVKTEKDIQYVYNDLMGTKVISISYINDDALL